MTVEEYERIREDFGFSQEAFGVWLGHSKRTGQRFSTGKKPIPKDTAMLLSLMVTLNISIQEAERGA